MKIDNLTKRVYVRQSWLGDMLMCPERARLATVHPHMRKNSDATIIGTALHYGIETILNSDTDISLEKLVATSVEEYQRLALEPYTETGIDKDKIIPYIQSMSEAWYTKIMPEIEFGGKTEHRFVLPIGVIIGGYDVHIEGTMDYISPSGVIWDWKTAGRAYSAEEKQRNAVQASMYAMAGLIEKLCPNENFVQFNYGIMIRQEKPKAQIVSIHRNQEHIVWLRNQIITTLQMGVTLGTENKWILNDQGFLCSPKWCNFWSMCKGATVSDASMRLA